MAAGQSPAAAVVCSSALGDLLKRQMTLIADRGPGATGDPGDPPLSDRPSRRPGGSERRPWIAAGDGTAGAGASTGTATQALQLMIDGDDAPRPSPAASLAAGAGGGAGAGSASKVNWQELRACEQAAAGGDAAAKKSSGGAEVGGGGSGPSRACGVSMPPPDGGDGDSRLSRTVSGLLCGAIRRPGLPALAGGVAEP